MTKQQQPPQTETHVSRTQALNAIKKDSAQDQDKSKRAELADAAAKAVEIEGRRSYFRLRESWSTTIILWITFLIGSNALITVAVGLGWLNYRDLEWFITAVVVQTFLQIVGLGAVAVKYLFSDARSSKMP
ncbi:hypothetical protein [Sinorhizobium sojae]|uniref:hypothetical protein n=1 Tax=Sinorhizobium sojae TaxID=716925 RepID=UPI0012F74DB8|nr:hypothetical protein [Sinorhizobium sojae]